MKIIGIALAVVVVILLAALLALAAVRWMDNAKMQRIRDSLRETDTSDETFSPDMVDGLPAPARRYLLHAVAPGTRLARRVEIRMTGTFKVQEGKPWPPLKASQIITPGRGFVWTARVAMNGPLFVEAVDHYYKGEGRTRVMLMGLVPIVNASGPDVAESAAGRLLAESVLIPSAFLLENGARWEQVDDSRARAVLSADGIEGEMTLTVDEQGRLVEAAIPRYNVEEKGPVPFRVFVEQERAFEGYTIPSSVRGGWFFEDGRRNEFFRFIIEQARFF